MTFTSEDSSVLRAEDDASVTLLGNAEGRIQLQVAVRQSSVQGALSISCNLQPSVGDVDLGRLTGIPIPPQTGIFTVPVRVNVGTQPLGSLKFSVQYDPDVLAVPNDGSGRPQIAASNIWTGGIFQGIVDPPGTIMLGGTVSPARTVTGTVIVGTLTFQTVGTGGSYITGSVETLRENDVRGTSIGSGAPRPFVAGSVGLSVLGQRTRKDVCDPARECCDAPCRVCYGQRTPGDLDYDCSTDIGDVFFL